MSSNLHKARAPALFILAAALFFYGISPWGSEDAYALGQTDLAAGQAATGGEAHWAFVNLLVLIAIIACCIFLLVLLVSRRKTDKLAVEEAEDIGTDEGAENAQRIKRKGVLRLGSIIPAVVAVIVFFFTQHLSAGMLIADSFTALMIIILVVQIAITAYAKVQKNS